jgi:TRAP-type C4-dicarboxylate transport system permease small subunit
MIFRLLDDVLRWLCWASSAIIMVIMLLVVSDVCGRVVFNNPIPGTTEITQALLVAMVFLAFGRTQAVRKHVAVEVLTSRLSQKSQIILEVFGLVLSLSIFGLFTWQSGVSAYRAWETGESALGLIDVPAWPAKFMALIGIFWFTMQLIADIRHNLQLLHSLKGTV